MSTFRIGKKAAIAITAGVVAVGAGGAGIAVIHHNHVLDEAREACVAATQTLQSNMDQYTALHDGDATDAASIEEGQVADETVVAAFVEEYEAEAPVMVSCDADNADSYRQAQADAESASAWYSQHTDSLKEASANVVASRDQKTLDDAKTEYDKQVKAAQKTYDESDGKVADTAVRDTLGKLLEEAKKADQTDAAKLKEYAKKLKEQAQKVTDSVAAKTKADEEATAKAEAEAAAAVQTNSQSYNYSYSDSGSSGTSSSHGSSSNYTSSNGYANTGVDSSGTSTNSSGNVLNGESSSGSSTPFNDDSSSSDDEVFMTCTGDTSGNWGTCHWK